MFHSPLRRSLIFAAVTLPFMKIGLAVATEEKLAAVQKALAKLELDTGGRLGISVINTADNSHIQYRAEERFPMCSTFKVMVVSAILKRNMTEDNLLQQRITYRKKDLVTYSPLTEKHLNEGMTVSSLCEAALQYSDNTAANLLMKIVGGPAGVTEFARSIGDETFRVDRWETELNSAIPGDLRDTSTPDAMAKSLQQIVLGDVLAKPQREQLQIWLKGNKTGGASIKAGVPEEWIVADKTGSGNYGTTNDIAVLWPSESEQPIVMAVYFTHHIKNAPGRKDVIASAAHIITNELKK